MTENKKQNKNIILCSDGTGNKGGTGSDTNVFKLYRALKQTSKNEQQQFIYYDNGVGTSSHKVWRAIGGAFGFGFKKNVRDLYEFAGRHYTDGDDIYGFGFSRGAATIRAFAGMVECCGLICRVTVSEDTGKTTTLSESEFQKQIDVAMKQYVQSGGERLSLGWVLDCIGGVFSRSDKASSASVKAKIEFLGLWDTVSALGFPQIPLLDAIVNRIRRHRFYNLEPTEIVNYVCHSLSLDDERRTFWPEVWNEKDFDDGHIEQVWFPGVHSNVGGGYPRSGLAAVALDWMIERLHSHQKISDDGRGLILEDSFEASVRDDINHHGKLYDSRDGFALLYRYQPRPLENLPKGRDGSQKIKIHRSVMSRLKHRTAGYSPMKLPSEFTVVETRTESGVSKDQLESPIVCAVNLSQPKPGKQKKKIGKPEINTEAKRTWKSYRRKIDLVTGFRIVLYFLLLFAVVSLAVLSGFFWIYDPYESAALSLEGGADRVAPYLKHLASFLRYVFPIYFENFINYSVLQAPMLGLSVLAAVGVFYLLRHFSMRLSEAIFEGARVFVVCEYLENLSDSRPQSKNDHSSE